jgi:asparagine synthase (glutamine-hydrolysing)
MCGIVGACLVNQVPDLGPRIAGMNALLTHRGPDSGGQFTHAGMSIAARRLAIIDLITGDQPLLSADGAVAAVLNGEIYNYRELTQELESRGFVFRTRADTEVLVHGYTAWGAGLCEKLKGMFAFAVVDTKASRLLLGRDRFGEKPLFYSEDHGDLVFASEIQALLEWPGIERSLDREAFSYFLRLGYAPSPLTLFSGVRELPPGCLMQWEAGKVSVRRYYDPDYTPDPSLKRYGVAIEAVQAAIERAVRRQMVADVPLGAFLSGGMDSSSVVAMLTRNSARPVKTFTVKFEEASYDESSVAQEVARHLGTEHVEIPVPNAGFQADDLWRIVERVGQPFSDSSAIPTYVIAKAVRQHVTVGLTGDGGDEMFAGYTTFPWAQAVDRIGRVPSPILMAARSVVRGAAWIPGLSSRSELRQITRALEAAARPPSQRLAAITALFQPRELHDLVVDPATREAACGSLDRFTGLPERAAQWTPMRRRMYTMLTHGLPQDMLVKIDRMSMACSLELRAPMLDPDLADLTMRLPDASLIHHGVQKRVLRDAMKSFLPDVLFKQPKSGFSIPLHRFRNEEYRELAHQLMSVRDGPMALLDTKALKEFVDRGLERYSDRADYSVFKASHQLWALMQLSAWTVRYKVAAPATG